MRNSKHWKHRGLDTRIVGPKATRHFKLEGIRARKRPQKKKTKKAGERKKKKRKESGRGRQEVIRKEEGRDTPLGVRVTKFQI